MKSCLAFITAVLIFGISDGMGIPLDIEVFATDAPIPIGSKGHYNYSEVIHASLLFYEAMRSGKLPADNRIHWRGDSMLDDGKDVGHDLSGGYFDAGDLVKFNLPLAYTMTVLSWGLIDFEDAYTKAGELENARKAIKWGTDYLIKCHTSEDELYGQVGNGEVDHAVWGRPEDWQKTGKARPAYKVTSQHGGSDLAGETAAALAAASIVFKKSDPTYSETLLKHSKSIYTFADKHRALYTTEITDAKSFYNSSGYSDELAWGAAWLLRATNDSTYQKEVDKHFQEFSKILNGRPYAFGWDDKTAGVQVLMAQITGNDKYKTLVKTFCDYILKVPKTPKGMIFLDKWGTLRHASDVSFICLQAAKIGIEAEEYKKFAVSQIGYILGDTGRSFVIGLGVNPPSHEHHRASSCTDPPNVKCDFESPDPNPHTLIGGIVGGPDEYDGYNDTRSDYVHNEVTEDYNACFQSSVAALLHFETRN